MRIRTLLPLNRPHPSGGYAVALAMTAGVSALGMTCVQPVWAKTNAALPLAVRGGLLLAQADAPQPVLLQPGTEGNEVVMLQRQMRLLGLYEGPVDGRYETATQEAIAAFQTSIGLPANGILDQVTWQRMSTPQLISNSTPPVADPPVLLSRQESSAQATAETSSDLATDSDAAPKAAPTAETAEPTNAVSIGPERSLGWLILGSLALAGSLGGWLWVGQGSARSQADESTTTPPQQDFPSPANIAGHGSASTFHPQAVTAAEASPPLETTTRLSPVDIVDSLVQDLASPDSAVRRHAIWELGQRGHSNVIQPLVDRLLEADSQEKSLIFAALAEISSRSLRPMHRALILGLQDPSPEVRKNAIRDLSRVYDTVVQLGPMLAHAAQDTDPGVQKTAQWALNQLNRIPAAEAHPAESTALEASYEGQEPTSDGHRLSPPHS